MKMEKTFASLRSFKDDHHNGKIKFCASCGNLATVEALFSVGGGLTVIERYCDVCGKKVKSQFTLKLSRRAFKTVWKRT